VTTPAGIESAARLQLRLLVENAPRVRRGGVLVYATCSLCRSENERVAEAFLGQGTGFVAAAPARRLMPWEHDGDGFFVAVFQRT
jgi:16S rRNA (cytosine967-C5)-methyltransferase